jgi:hypothetical protein
MIFGRFGSRRAPGTEVRTTMRYTHYREEQDAAERLSRALQRDRNLLTQRLRRDGGSESQQV